MTAIDHFPHCKRADLSAAVSKGPLFDRIFEAASSFKLLERQQDLIASELAELQCAIDRARQQGWPETAERLQAKIQCLKVESERLCTLLKRAKDSIPEFPIEKVTAVYTVYSRSSGEMRISQSRQNKECA